MIKNSKISMICALLALCLVMTIMVSGCTQTVIYNEEDTTLQTTETESVSTENPEEESVAETATGTQIETEADTEKETSASTETTIADSTTKADQTTAIYEESSSEYISKTESESESTEETESEADSTSVETVVDTTTEGDTEPEAESTEEITETTEAEETTTAIETTEITETTTATETTEITETTTAIETDEITQTTTATETDEIMETTTVTETTTVEETESATEEVTFPEPQEGTDIFHEGFGENKNYVVVIDAGHQRHGMSAKEPNGPGSDVMKAMVSSGTYGRFTGVYEYELNLAVAMALRNELMSRGYTVVMVRETHDVEVSNVGRAQIANKYAPSEENGYVCTINIRIHANGSENSSANGALMCSPTKNNPYKIGELYEECVALANAIIDPYCEATGIKKSASHILFGDNMTGTNWSEVPTTILEMGFMTNRNDDRRMQSEGFNENAASGIADGIETFFKAYR